MRSAPSGGDLPLPRPPETAAWFYSLLADPAPRVDDALAARAAVEVLLSELPAERPDALTLLSLEERSLEEVSCSPAGAAPCSRCAPSSPPPAADRGAATSLAAWRVFR